MAEARKFRDAMGTFATGVTVVTTKVARDEFGMTANAFMSVSLDPKLVVISVDKKAKMHEYIRNSGSFAVSILSSEQKEISMQFAGQKKDGYDVPFEHLTDFPVIRGALAQVVCRVVRAHEEGDHTLYIGEVEHLQVNEGDPLLFFAGNYREIADVPKKIEK